METKDLDVAVEQRVYTENAAGQKIYQPGYKGIYNLSKAELARVVTKGYQAVQHAEVVEGTETALNNLGIRNYQKRVVQQGHKVTADFTFPDVVIKLERVGEEFATGIRVINSYDTSTGIVIVTRLSRLVCSNGMVLKHNGEGLILKHNSSLIPQLQSQIEITIKNMVNSHANLQAMVENCIADSIEWTMVDKIMMNLIGRKNHIEAITALLPAGRPPTRWELYNAITEHATHGKQLRPSIEAWLQNKAEKVLMTDSAGLMPAVVEVTA